MRNFKTKDGSVIKITTIEQYQDRDACRLLPSTTLDFETATRSRCATSHSRLLTKRDLAIAGRCVNRYCMPALGLVLSRTVFSLGHYVRSIRTSLPLGHRVWSMYVRTVYRHSDIVSGVCSDYVATRTVCLGYVRAVATRTQCLGYFRTLLPFGHHVWCNMFGLCYATRTSCMGYVQSVVATQHDMIAEWQHSSKQPS